MSKVAKSIPASTAVKPEVVAVAANATGLTAQIVQTATIPLSPQLQGRHRRKLSRQLQSLADKLGGEGWQFEPMPCEVLDKLTDLLAQFEQTLEGYTQPKSSRKTKNKLAKEQKVIKSPAYINRLGLKEEHLTLLNFLKEWKFGTTWQITHHLGLNTNRVAARLRELEKAGLVKAYRYRPDFGNRSEKCWWLWYGGAKLLTSQTGQKVTYDPRMANHPPDLNRIRLRTMELEIETQVQKAAALLVGPSGSGESVTITDGWQLVRPQEFNSVHPKQEDAPTPQFKVLADALTRTEERENQAGRRRGLRMDSRIEEYNARAYLDDVPFHANDYVAYLPDSERAVVLILCPPDITDKFWKARIAQYSSLAERIRVFGVFYEKHQALAWLEHINEAQIRVVTIDKVAQLLLDIASS